ncbi:MAG: hypothetical protein JOZ18_12940 [Chloroflexi bacterium]|nr:hypothetical protein [Chloroflexota bacterium]
MQPRIWKQRKLNTTLSLYLKCGAILLLFLLSVLIVACSDGTGAANTTGSLNGPVVTVTIHLGDGYGNSPTPTLPDYTCGAWATQTTPPMNMASNVGVYAKFVHNVNGNPEGVDGATATALVLWPDGTNDTLTTNTTPDGLATFSIPIADKASAVNKITLVKVTFSKPGIPTCTVDVDRAAFFTLVIVSPTASPDNGNGNGNGKHHHH